MDNGRRTARGVASRERGLPLIYGCPTAKPPAGAVVGRHAHHIEKAKKNAPRADAHQLPERLLDAWRKRVLPACDGLLGRYGFLHGGSSFDLGRSPRTLPAATDGAGGPPSSSSTGYGTTSGRVGRETHELADAKGGHSSPPLRRKPSHLHSIRRALRRARGSPSSQSRHPRCPQSR